jgi:hypothetical protein
VLYGTAAHDAHICTSYGTFLFNNLVSPPLKSLRLPAATAGREDEARALLADAEESVDATAVLPAAAGRTGFDVVPAAGGMHGASSGGAEALRSSEARGFDVAGAARSS